MTGKELFEKLREKGFLAELIKLTNVVKICKDLTLVTSKNTSRTHRFKL